MPLIRTEIQSNCKVKFSRIAGHLTDKTFYLRVPRSKLQEIKAAVIQDACSHVQQQHGQWRCEKGKDENEALQSLKMAKRGLQLSISSCIQK
jgi:hypothetical protein